MASERWLGSDPSRAEVLDQAATGLHAFDTTKAGETAYVGSGEVPGYLLSQWSLSEHERRAAGRHDVDAAVGVRRPQRERRADARGARRAAGRDRPRRRARAGRAASTPCASWAPIGFVVTFRQVDPLYTLDLSDPRAPAVVGELKVPGYSAYLHPLGDGLLLGVGQNADRAGPHHGRAGLAVRRLGPRNPIRLAQRGLGRYTYTPIENDHHAFFWWAPERLAVIPFNGYADEGDFSGATAFRVDPRGRGIEEAARFVHPPGLALGVRPVGRRRRPAAARLSDVGMLSTPLAAPGAGDFVAF